MLFCFFLGKADSVSHQPGFPDAPDNSACLRFHIQSETLPFAAVGEYAWEHTDMLALVADRRPDKEPPSLYETSGPHLYARPTIGSACHHAPVYRVDRPGKKD